MNIALNFDAECFDALQAQCSLYLSQSKPNEATQLLASLYAKIKAIRDRIHARTVLDDLKMNQNNSMQEEDEDDEGTSLLIPLIKLILLIRY